MTNAAPLAVVVRGWGSASALGLNDPGPTPAAPAAGESSAATAPAASTVVGPVHAPVSAFRPHAATGLPVAALPAAAEAALAALRQQRPAYRSLDRSVLLALLTAARATAQAGWQPADAQALAVSIGSSRGATEQLEAFHETYQRTGTVPVAASPLSTLGNVASWVADAAGGAGAAISHSSTCSTALQALGNALAWLRAGLATRFLAGGTEAPLTPFTLAQMQALGIYSDLAPEQWPCRPGAGGPSTFVLGEGAAVFALEAVPATSLRPGDLLLESVGFGFEATGTRTGLTPDGQHFQQAMRQALTLAGRRPQEIDLLVLHSPGTRAGDAAERAALAAVFGAELPACASNKWQLGHTLGASGALSMAWALELLRGTVAATPLPFESWLNERPLSIRPRRILLNAAGFGGNAGSALVSMV